MKSLSTSHFSTQQERRIKNPNWSKDCLSLPGQTTMRAEAASSSRPRFKSAPRSYPAGGANVIDDIGIDSEDDWLVSCNRCDKGGESMLSCCGCPIYLHASCITVNYAPQFDKFGKFWCPPCNYKRATDRFEEMRMRAVVDKKALSAFMAGAGFGNMVGDDAKKRWIDAIKRKNDAIKRRNDAKKRRNDAKERGNDEMDLDRVVRTEGVGGCENDMDGADAKMVQCDHGETRAEDHEFVHRNEGDTPGIESFGVSTTKENANVDNMVEVREDEVLENEGGIQKKDDRQVTASQDEGILHGKQVRHFDSYVEESIISVPASDEEVLENEGEVLENKGGIQKEDDGRVTGSQDQGILHGKLVQHLDSCCEEETVTASASDGNHESLEEQTQLTPYCQETTPLSPRENVALVVHGNKCPSWRRILDLAGVWKSILGKRKRAL